MNIRLSFLFFLIVFPGIAQEDAPNQTDAAGKKQGHWIKYDDNHKKIYDGNFVNGIPVGKFTYYYDTGIPWAVTIFMKSGKVAYTKHYSAGGKLSGFGKYVNEKKDSLWKFFNEDSVVISEENYINGLKNGISRVLYPNGQVAEEKNWKMGKLNGPCKKYFDSGQLKFTGNYVNDKVDGKAVYYYPSGKIDGQGVYKNDLKDGVWNYYQENGQVRRTDTYVNGKMIKSTDLDYQPKEKSDSEKKMYEQREIKDPYEEGYRPE